MMIIVGMGVGMTTGGGAGDAGGTGPAPGSLPAGAKPNDQRQELSTEANSSNGQPANP